MTGLLAIRDKDNSYLRTVVHVLTIIFAAVIPLSNSMTTIVSLLVAIACALYIDRANFIVIIKHPVTIAILIFIALNIIGVSYSMAAKDEIYQALRKYTRLLYFPLLLPLFYQSHWRHAAIITFVAAVLVSVLAALNAQMLVFKDSIFTSLFVAFAIFILAHYTYDYKRYRLLTIPLISLFSYYLFFINIGRIGQLVFIMLFVLFAWQRVRHTIKNQILTVSSLLLIVIGSMVFPSSFMARQNVAFQEIDQYIKNDVVPHESSIGTRLILAQNSLQLIKLKPWFGFGTGSFGAAYAEYANEKTSKEPRVNPHNQYLLEWVELGILGILSLLYLLWSLTSTFIDSKSTHGYLGIGLVLALAVGCCFNSWLLDFTSAFFFIFFAAVFASGISEQKISH